MASDPDDDVTEADADSRAVTDPDADSDSRAHPDVEGAPDGDTASDEPPEASGSGVDENPSGARSREVLVPMRVYKTVTVFSTLFAVVFVLVGFLLLDDATDRATAAISEVDPVIAVLGLASILFGAAVYAYGTRFRAEGMGTSKDEADQPETDG